MAKKYQQEQSETKLTTVRNGEVVAEKGKAEILEEERKLAEKTGDIEKQKMLSEGSSGEKSTRRDLIYKIQDWYAQKIAQKQKEIQIAATAKERDMILQEVKQLGEFCHRLEDELKWMRRN